ncbi:hypothetical protein [Bacillus thuringiensis]|nr:hypothetical protein [Bacillus thuringiensis]RGP45185.1 hypothetical protein BTW32_25740 [Bacillus thuringiensis]
MYQQIIDKKQIENKIPIEQTVKNYDFHSITRQIVSSWIEKKHRLISMNHPNQPTGNRYRIEGIDNTQVKELQVNVGSPKRVSTGAKELIRTLSHTAENMSKGQLEVGYVFKDFVTEESSFTNLSQITHITGISQEIDIRIGAETNGFSSKTGIKYEYQHSKGTASMKGQSRELGFEFPVKGVLPPQTKAELFTKIYKEKATYEYEGYSYYSGNITFTYKLLNVPGAHEQLVTRDIGTMMYELTDEGERNLLQKGFRAAYDPINHQDTLRFKGKAILEIDNEFTAITGMTELEAIK